MNRRAFLHRFIRNSLAAFAVAALPLVRASASLTPAHGYLDSRRLGRRFQGTIQGRLLESLDSGRTWRQAAYFGSQVEVLRVYEGGSTLYLDLSIQGHPFTLKSPDGHHWWTAPAVQQG